MNAGAHTCSSGRQPAGVVAAVIAGTRAARGRCEPHIPGLHGLEGVIADATGTCQHPWGWVGPGATVASNPAESFLPAGPGPLPTSTRALPWREGMCLWTTSWKPAPCSPWAYTLASRPMSSRSHRSCHCHRPGRGAGMREGSEGAGMGRASHTPPPCPFDPPACSFLGLHWTARALRSARV